MERSLMMKMFYVFALQNGSHEMNVAIEHLICGYCTCVDHNKLWKVLKEMGLPDHPTCLLRNLYVKQQLEPDME